MKRKTLAVKTAEKEIITATTMITISLTPPQQQKFFYYAHGKQHKWKIIKSFFQ